MQIFKIVLNLIESQHRYWKNATDLFGINQDNYIKAAVDRMIALDLDQMDPKWKKFNEATREQQQLILGLTFKDKDMKDYLRYQSVMAEAKEILKTRMEKKGSDANQSPQV